MIPSSSNRHFNCRDEELVMICKYAGNSLENDLADFMAFSPRFNQDYLTEFKNKTTQASELVEPQTETLARKEITDRLRKNAQGLLNPVNHIEGYLRLAKNTLNMTPTSFGIANLRKKINNNDVEGILNAADVLLSNIDRYKTVLVAQGLTDKLLEDMQAALDVLDADRQSQYAILNHRRGIVENNLETLNGLYDKLSEIMNIGKVLYKTSKPAKSMEYTMTKLKSRVRTTRTPNSNQAPTEPEG